MATTVLTEGRHPAEMILSEANGQRSRAGALIIGPAVIRPGMVLLKVAATTDVAEHYIPGTTVAHGDAIALYGCVTDTGENASIAILNRDCEVNGHILEYFAGATDPNKVAIMAVLASHGILVRN